MYVINIYYIFLYISMYHLDPSHGISHTTVSSFQNLSDSNVHRNFSVVESVGAALKMIIILKALPRISV